MFYGYKRMIWLDRKKLTPIDENPLDEYGQRSEKNIANAFEFHDSPRSKT